MASSRRPNSEVARPGDVTSLPGPARVPKPEAGRPATSARWPATPPPPHGLHMHDRKPPRPSPSDGDRTSGIHGRGRRRRTRASPSRGTAAASAGPLSRSRSRRDLTATRRRGPDAKGGGGLAASRADGDADAGTGGRRRDPGDPPPGTAGRLGGRRRPGQLVRRHLSLPYMLLQGPDNLMYRWCKSWCKIHVALFVVIW
jgi:hypothetical protein